MLSLVVAVGAVLSIGVATCRYISDPSNNAGMKTVARISSSTDPGVHTVAFADSPTEPTLVGREICRECHAENYAFHSKHGHASTFHLVSQTDLAPNSQARVLTRENPTERTNITLMHKENCLQRFPLNSVTNPTRCSMRSDQDTMRKRY